MRFIFIALLLVGLSYAQPQPCPEGQVWCNGTTDPIECIPEAYECDFEYFDCSNDWDEDEHCPCRPEEYTCADGQCIWGLEKDCNGYRECNDGSDEMNCTTCRVFQCDDGSCLSDYYVCDGRDDCPNGEDEQPGCPKCDPRMMYTCEDLSCIFKSDLCNGRVDCPTGEDEMNCTTCQRYAFQCDDGSCVAEEEICDGKDDCPNGEEEEPDCPHCNPSQIKCDNGTKCIDRYLTCDGVNDCLDGADEMNCTICKYFQCDDGSCITQEEWCDAKNDCPDGEDEEPGCVKCNPRYQWECEDHSICIIKQEKCNGYVDCPDGSDENNCTLANTQLFASKVSEQEILGARKDSKRTFASVTHPRRKTNRKEGIRNKPRA